MADFDIAYGWALPHEGGYVNDPDDPGGATKYGITQNTLDDARLRLPFLPDNVKNLTVAQAGQIYKMIWWRFGDLEQRLATKLFDLSINMGGDPAHGNPAIKCLQQALNNILFLGLREDGVYGPVTAAAAATADQSRLLRALCATAQAHYEAIIQAHPACAKFRRGWIARANDLP